MGRRFFFVVVIVYSASWQSCVNRDIPRPINCDEHPVVLELVSIEDSNCGLAVGSVEVRASGGTGIYLFKLGDNDVQIASVFQNLGAGAYEISAADENGCSSTLEVVIKNKIGLNITFETNEAGCNDFNGNIILTPIDGVAPYNYKIDNSAFTADSSFTDLGRGDYTVVVKDATGCEISQMIKIKSGVSFSASVSNIINTNCVVAGCHNGTQFPDFRIFKNIHDNASQIKTLTGNRIMPQKGSLTQAEITTIACWVDDGALEN